MKKKFIKGYALFGFFLYGVYLAFLVWMVTDQFVINQDSNGNDYVGVCLSLIIAILFATSWLLYFYRIWKSEQLSMWLLDTRTFHGKILSVLYAVSNIIMSVICIGVMSTLNQYHIVNIDTMGVTYDLVRDEAFSFFRVLLWLGSPLVLVPIIQIYYINFKKRK